MTITQAKEQLAEKIKLRLKELEINKIQFTELMNVQPSTITKWLSGKHNFTLKTIYKIERKLNISLINLSQ
jgi:transcriptional regulator with XRE-family HTH domain